MKTSDAFYLFASGLLMLEPKDYNEKRSMAQLFIDWCKERDIKVDFKVKKECGIKIIEFKGYISLPQLFDVVDDGFGRN